MVEHVYAAGCDPAQWPAFVEKVHAVVPGIAFSTHLDILGTTIATNSAAAGIAHEHVKSYMEHYQHFNPYKALFPTLTPGKVYTSRDVLPSGWLDRHVFYHEWLKPAGNFTSGASVMLARDDRRLMRVSFDIPDRIGHLEGACADLLGRIGPHMTRAFEVNEQLQAAVATTQALDSVLDRVEGAAVVLSSGGHVMALNAAAEAMLRLRSLIAVGSDNRLAFRQPAYESAYRRALALAVDTASPDAPHAFNVADAALPAGIVVVLPLRPHTDSIALSATQPRALIIIRTANSKSATPKELLRSLYGLTPAEADAAHLIATGASVAEVSATLSVTQVTVRNQLAAAMTKMGVHRQAELVAAVTRLAPRLKLDGTT